MNTREIWRGRDRGGCRCCQGGGGANLEEKNRVNKLLYTLGNLITVDNLGRVR